MKIAIITLFDNGNYGSELQSLALSRYLSSKGNNVTLCHIKAPGKFVRLLEVLTDRIVLKFNTAFSKEKKQYFADCINNVSKQRFISPELKQYVHSFVSKHVISKRISRWNFPNKQFDAYVCGSDQIWSALKLPVSPYRFLHRVNPDKKIAYAPSIGLDSLPLYYIKQTKKYISDFKYLSVRESLAKQALKEHMDLDAIQVLDPTMLVGTEMWDDLLDKEGKKGPNHEYVFCYFLGEMYDDTISCINEIAEGREVLILPHKEDSQKVLNGKYELADPLDFVNLIKNAKYVLTDSFHGSVFSVLYNKQFVVTKRSHVGRVSQTSRITSLLSKFGFEAQYCQHTEEMLDALRTPINYNSKTQILHDEQNISREFLNNALMEINIDIKNE